MADTETSLARRAIPRRPPVILVVDDDESIRELMLAALETMGATVVLAEDGEEGLRVARSVRPDLAIIDLEMPRLDGARLISLLRAESAFAHLPILLCTAHPRFVRLVGVPVLPKPFRLGALLDTVQELVPVASSAAEG